MAMRGIARRGRRRPKALVGLSLPFIPSAAEALEFCVTLRAGFFACLGSRREDWARRMLRSAHVLKGAGNVDWLTFAGTAKVLLDGRALETIPIMEYVWQRTNMVLVNEDLLRGREEENARHDGEA